MNDSADKSALFRRIHGPDFLRAPVAQDMYVPDTY
jgi:hypothetical protein